MFGPRYFGPHYFGRRYFGSGAGVASGTSYFGGKYFGERYFGQRYWATRPTSGTTFDVEQTADVAITGVFAGTPPIVGNIQFFNSLDISQTAAIALTGLHTLTGNIGYQTAFEIQPPLNINSIGGTIGVAGDIAYTIAFNVARTAAIGVNGTVGVTGGIETICNVAPGTIVFGGNLGVVGDIEFSSGPSFDVAETAGIGLNGTMTTVGDLSTAIVFVLNPTAAVAMNGTQAVSGDIAFASPHNIVQTANLAFSGTMGIVGNLKSGTEWVLPNADAISVAGSLGIRGDIQFHFNTPDPDHHVRYPFGHHRVGGRHSHYKVTKKG